MKCPICSCEFGHRVDCPDHPNFRTKFELRWEATIKAAPDDVQEYIADLERRDEEYGDPVVEMARLTSERDFWKKTAIAWGQAARKWHKRALGYRAAYRALIDARERLNAQGKMLASLISEHGRDIVGMVIHSASQRDALQAELAAARKENAQLLTTIKAVTPVSDELGYCPDCGLLMTSSTEIDSNMRYCETCDDAFFPVPQPPLRYAPIPCPGCGEFDFGDPVACGGYIVSWKCNNCGAEQSALLPRDKR